MPIVSESPNKYKFAGIKSLFFRAKVISSTDYFYREAIETINDIFLLNGYSLLTIDRCREKAEQSATNYLINRSNNSNVNINDNGNSDNKAEQPPIVDNTGDEDDINKNDDIVVKKTIFVMLPYSTNNSKV